MSSLFRFCYVLLLTLRNLQAFVLRNRRINQQWLTFACRRNNKEEKRERNRAYANKFRLKDGGTRKEAVREVKRNRIASLEEAFCSQLFPLTGDITNVTELNALDIPEDPELQMFNTSAPENYEKLLSFTNESFFPKNESDFPIAFK